MSTDNPPARRFDALRQFLISFPDWEEYGLAPPTGKFVGLSQIAAGSFGKAAGTTQLALQYTGSSPVRTGSDPLFATYVRGDRQVTRQASFDFLIMQRSVTSGERADMTEFLWAFTEWLDAQAHAGTAPKMGDEPATERIWATNGGTIGIHEEGKASLYLLNIHIEYIKHYDPIF